MELILEEYGQALLAMIAGLAVVGMVVVAFMSVCDGGTVSSFVADYMTTLCG